MARNPFSIALLSEETKSRSHVLFHPFASLVRIGESWDSTKLECSAAISACDSLEFGIVGSSRDVIILAYQDR